MNAFLLPFAAWGCRGSNKCQVVRVFVVPLMIRYKQSRDLSHNRAQCKYPSSIFVIRRPPQSDKKKPLFRSQLVAWLALTAVEENSHTCSWEARRAS
jgi:hypothetical protein